MKWKDHTSVFMLSTAFGTYAEATVKKWDKTKIVL